MGPKVRRLHAARSRSEEQTTSTESQVQGEPGCTVLVLEVRLHPPISARQRGARGDGVARFLLPTTTTAASQNEDANRIN